MVASVPCDVGRFARRPSIDVLVEVRDAEADHGGKNELGGKCHPQRMGETRPEHSELDGLVVREIREIRKVSIGFDDQMAQPRPDVIPRWRVPDPELRRPADELALERSLAAMLCAHRTVDHRLERTVAIEMPERPRAGVLLVEDDRVLLIERHRDGLHYFVCPGGGVEPGESFEHAAVREAHEEFDIDVSLESVGLDIQFGGRQVYFFAHVVSGTVGEVFFDAKKLRGSYRPVWVSVHDLDQHDVRPPELAELFASS